MSMNTADPIMSSWTVRIIVPPEYFSVKESMDLDSEKRDWMKWLPLIALTVAICALMFQVTVLYPWHEELSHQFGKMSRCMKCVR
jgi:hypothetical protein